MRSVMESRSPAGSQLLHPSTSLDIPKVPALYEENLERRESEEAADPASRPPNETYERRAERRYSEDRHEQAVTKGREQGLRSREDASRKPQTGVMSTGSYDSRRRRHAAVENERQWDFVTRRISSTRGANQDEGRVSLLMLWTSMKGQADESERRHSGVLRAAKTTVDEPLKLRIVYKKQQKSDTVQFMQSLPHDPKNSNDRRLAQHKAIYT
ncbi:hypothetical protein EJ05DRAFT_535673 [Pseudovirgaria hyperparasitica]|uniref:Uncharacterized protein n=1 Tax=Pseudovirgaria hyperparasitica TaxID=470096 RepID=A0A6A6WFE0_9PEZI|nr:uncharacterized protein EJ05DRAFT_535673 [Pseudovirgaria hyperparasitica]KAF2760754.1 hypothetical protein EJ05DRAFT_535673 [Pseudovirgaria hyperparasitica]